MIYYIKRIFDNILNKIYLIIKNLNINLMLKKRKIILIFEKIINIKIKNRNNNYPIFHKNKKNFS